MNKLAKLPLTLLAASLALPTALLAQEAPRPAAPQPPSMMDHGAMPGGDMTGQMSKMMENCNRMMESMNERQKTPAK
jgi:hypothetical protein